MMTKLTPLVAAILALLLSGYSNADELTDAAAELCDTIKACAMEAVAGANLSAELQAMMEPVWQSNCAELSKQVLAVPASNPLYQPATACLSSMASLSCSMLYNMSQVKTAECAEYEKLLKAASGAQP